VSELVTASQAAELLAVSPDTIRRWAREGRIKVVVLPSGQQRFLRAELASYSTPRSHK
jgi:excisionase family DNA binding protein